VLIDRPPSPPATTARLLITELVYNPFNEPSIEPAGEWVEIYNPGENVVLLSAYKLGDEEAFGGDEGMMQFPAEILLDPGSVVVVANQGVAFQTVYGFPPDFEMVDSDPYIPDMLPYPVWSTGRVEFVNMGDEILLLDGNDTVVDALSWGNSTWVGAFDPPPPSVGDGESLERSPAYQDSDSAADWVRCENPKPYQLDLSAPTPTVSPTPEIPTGSTQLLVSEVFYDPSGVDPGGEWIEVYNVGPENAALWKYRLGDEETQGEGEGMYFFPPGYVLLIEQTAVIAQQSVEFENLYGFKPDFEISDTDPGVPDMIKDPTWANGSMNLSSSGDDILLLDGADLLVDGVSWGDSDLVLDPSVPKVDPDHAIERFPPQLDTDTASDWRAQPNPMPGEVDYSTPTLTPTPTSTPTPEPLPDLIINEIHADPHPDEGDANGDGDNDMYDDEFVEIINTTSEEIDISGWSLSDAVGVRHIFSGTTIIPSGCGIIIFGGGSPMGDFGDVIVQVASNGTLGLNNTGDTLTLRDSNDQIVYTHNYGSNAGDDQSITRDPDINGPDPMVKHSEATGSNGALYSPGTLVDGTSFGGCTPQAILKRLSRTRDG
jgi:hypothetical protein